MVVVPMAAWSLPVGAVLDAALGDPRGWPHPVRAIGAAIAVVERGLRAIVDRTGTRWWVARAAGIVLAVAVPGATCLAVLATLAAVDQMGEVVSLIGRSLLVYWGLAARSLGDEAKRAADVLDLAAARRELAMIVGRDTGSLDRGEICRACVETVAENCNDAVVAPLFWYAVAGPAGLWTYKAISTLDSMVGYRNARYRDLGWASARLDDLAALVPARLTWLLVALAAAIVGERGRSALRVGWRDSRKHPSPNAAWGEAAMAGALGVRLGGEAAYGGIPSHKPWLGDPGEPIDALAVHRAVRVMHAASVLAVLLAWALRIGLGA